MAEVDLNIPEPEDPLMHMSAKLEQLVLVAEAANDYVHAMQSAQDPRHAYSKMVKALERLYQE